MRKRMITALLFASVAVGPAAAQRADNARGGIPTDTQSRHADNGYNPIWDLVGALGLLGLFGFWRPSDNDGYTDDPV